GRQGSFAAGTSGTKANISGTYPRVAEGLVTQMVITHNAAYQAEDLDAYDSDCDDFSTAKAVLMANLSSYILDVLSEVNKDNLIANESLSDELERYKEWVKLLEERQNVDLSTREKLIMDNIIRKKNAQFADFEKEINYLKQTLSKQSKEKELLTEAFNVLKNKSKEKKANNIDKEIALEKKVKELDNIETNVISIADSEEALMLEEESRSKMLLKQIDPMVLEKKVDIKPINYAELNRLSKDFGDDPIDDINKMMSFLSTVITSRFPTTNNQLRNSSNPRQQETIHDGRVIVQPVQGRQGSFAAGTSGTKANISGTYPRVAEGLVTQTVITHNAAYQAEDLDAYDSDCDDFSTANAVLMANLSSYILDVLYEVPHFENTHIDTLNQNVQDMSYSEQTHLVNYPENKITSDRNIITYS
nr:hypothetical protein [Tanacetum cinerariifolium]